MDFIYERKSILFLFCAKYDLTLFIVNRFQITQKAVLWNNVKSKTNPEVKRALYFQLFW